MGKDHLHWRQSSVLSQQLICSLTTVSQLFLENLISISISLTESVFNYGDFKLRSSLCTLLFQFQIILKIFKGFSKKSLEFHHKIIKFDFVRRTLNHKHGILKSILSQVCHKKISKLAKKICYDFSFFSTVENNMLLLYHF